MKRAAFFVGKDRIEVEADAAFLGSLSKFLRLDGRRRRASMVFRVPAHVLLSGEATADWVVARALEAGRAKGWHFIHSGAVAAREGAALFIGRSFSGKSTLSLLLASRGYPLLSDELNVLRAKKDGWHAAGFPLVPQARETAFTNVPTLARLKPGLERTPRNKWLVPYAAGAEAPVARIFFLRYDPKAVCRFTRVAPAALGKTLATHTAGYVTASDAGLLDFVLSLRKLARQGRVWTCAYSDKGFAALTGALEREFLGPAWPLKKRRLSGIVAGSKRKSTSSKEHR